MKVRQNLYIDRSLMEALNILVAREGGNKSRIVNAALEDLLTRRGNTEVGDAKARLDLMSRELILCRADLGVLLEAFALFVHYQLIVTGPVPEDDQAMLAIGNDRFQRYISQLARHLASGRRTFGENLK